MMMRTAGVLNKDREAGLDVQNGGQICKAM